MGVTIYSIHISNDRNDKEIVSLKKEIETFKNATKKQNEAQVEEIKEEVGKTDDSNIETIETTKENKYDIFSNSYQKALSKLGSNGDKYQMYASMLLDAGKTCNAYVDTTSMVVYLYTNSESIQIDTNVINVYNGTMGQQGGGDFVFIHKDGTASKCSWNNIIQGKYNVEKIQNAKNIVSVVNMDALTNGTMGGFMTYFLIDIDGNMIIPE